MAGRKVKAGKPKSGDWKHIVERGGRLYLRLRVPTDVVQHFGDRSHIERSLNTSDIVTARKERTKALLQWEAAFEEARSLPPPEAYREALKNYYLDAGPVSPEVIRRLRNALRIEAEIIAKADEEYEDHLEREHQSARAWVDGMSESKLEELRNQALYGHRVKALAGHEARPIAEFAAAPIVAPDEVLAAMDRVEGKAEEIKPVETGHGIWAAWEAYKEESRPSGKTAHEWKRSLELFKDAMKTEESPPRTVEEITREHVRAFARYLRARPSSRGGIVSDSTINKRIGALRSILEIAAKNDWIIKNPASGLTRRDRKAAANRRRLPLLIAEIESIEADIDPTSPDVWIWRLLRYTGARLGEVAQLHKDDIKRHQNGIWYIRIHEEGEGRSVKNASSIRYVPLHSAMSEAFCDWVRRQPSGPLWPDCWRKIKEGDAVKLTTWTDALSKRLNRRIRAAGIVDPRKTLHSLRHAFKDARRNTTPDEELRDAILGHTGSAMVGRDYGDGHFLSKLAEAINRIDPAEIHRLQVMDANPWQIEELDDEAEDMAEAEVELV